MAWALVATAVGLAAAGAVCLESVVSIFFEGTAAESRSSSVSSSDGRDWSSWKHSYPVLSARAMATSFCVSTAESALSPSDANVSAAAAEPNADCSCPMVGAFRAPSPLGLALMVCAHGHSIVFHTNTEMHATPQRERISRRQCRASYILQRGVTSCSRCCQQTTPWPRQWTKALFCLSSKTSQNDVISARFAKRQAKLYVACQEGVNFPSLVRR